MTPTQKKAAVTLALEALCLIGIALCGLLMLAM